jgi:hypothetical protein
MAPTAPMISPPAPQRGKPTGGTALHCQPFASGQVMGGAGLERTTPLTIWMKAPFIIAPDYKGVI